MSHRIHGAKKQTDNPFLNLYALDVSFRSGTVGTYYVSSRQKSTDALRAVSGESKPDGVVICALHGEKRDRIVLVKQFRYPIGDYCYEFPSGLIDAGENLVSAGKRELYEETGLTLESLPTNGCCNPFFTSVGMTDEACATVFGYASGTPTSVHEEETEDIQVVLADREECKRILKEEKVAIMCAYILMHFIASEDPFAFLNID